MKFEEDKARKKIELKCANVDDLVIKLKTFKGALHNNTCLETHLVQDQSKWNTHAAARHDCAAARASYSHSGCFLSPSRRHTPQHVPSHVPCDHAVPPCELTVGRVALGLIFIYRRAPAHFSLRDRTRPKTKQNGPPNKGCDRTSGPCDRATMLASLLIKPPNSCFILHLIYLDSC
ncbi:hypothetical protein PIB30_064008 [Stylosanthes scabra]|uniref:Uncharacterized protein n=1 Tax=Stylosanthes scabra TaxID=79078 RepID=A0ABU6YJS7_9FABA|nr:hypothetical protein [Stylosanthes scabra]